MHGKLLTSFGKRGSAAAIWWVLQLIFTQETGSAKVSATLSPGLVRAGGMLTISPPSVYIDCFKKLMGWALGAR